MRTVFLLLFSMVLVFSLCAEVDMGLGIVTGVQLLDGIEFQITASGTIPTVPVYIGMGIVLFEDPVEVNGTATIDWLMVSAQIAERFYFTTGPGIGLEFPGPVRLGARVPIGLHWFPGKKTKSIELFVEGTPTIVFLGDKSVPIPSFRLPLMIGTRFWF